MSDFIQKFDTRMGKDEKLKKLYLEELLILNIANIVSELMEKQKITKADLARHIGCSKGYITQVLDGTKNLTLKTVSNLLFELGYSLSVTTNPVKKIETTYETIRFETYFSKNATYRSATTDSYDLQGWKERIAI
jgi:transcriptional regulator with XRE-family HTH domain